MLTRLAIKNFRLLRDVSIDIEPGKPIVLIGPNSSGKSSVLEVLDLLSRWVATDEKNAFAPLGGVASVIGPYDDFTQLEVELSGLGSGNISARYGVDFDDTPGVAVSEEWLSTHSTGATEKSTARLSRNVNNAWILNEKTKEKDEISTVEHNNLLFNQIKQPAVYGTLGFVSRELSSIIAYGGFSTKPQWSRDPRESRISPTDSAILAPAPRLEPRGFNLVNALYHLHAEHFDRWQELIAAFCAEFPFVARLEFPADPGGGRIALAWRDLRHPAQRMHGFQMSEGMLSYLCLLAAILSPEPATAIAFDEPDAPLHPSAIRRLVHLLEEASNRTAVIVTTHSDRFLDYLSDPAGSLRVCEPTKEGVVIRPLDREALDEWRRDYSLSELRAKGYLDTTNSSVAEA